MKSKKHTLYRWLLGLLLNVVVLLNGYAQDVQLGIPTGHTGSIKHFEVNTKHGLALSSDYDKSYLWNIDAKKLVKTIDAIAVTFSHDLDQLYIYTGTEVLIKSLKDFSTLKTLTLTNQVNSIYESSRVAAQPRFKGLDGGLILLLEYDKRSLIDTKTGRIKSLKKKSNKANKKSQIEIIPNGSGFVLSENDKLTIYQKDEKAQLKVENLHAFAIYPGMSRIFLLNKNGLLSLVDFKSRKTIHSVRLPFPVDNNTKIKVSNNGQKIVLNSRSKAAGYQVGATGFNQEILAKRIFMSDNGKDFLVLDSLNKKYNQASFLRESKDEYITLTTSQLANIAGAYLDYDNKVAYLNAGYQIYTYDLISNGPTSQHVVKNMTEEKIFSYKGMLLAIRERGLRPIISDLSTSTELIYLEGLHFSRYEPRGALENIYLQRWDDRLTSADYKPRSHRMVKWDATSGKPITIFESAGSTIDVYDISSDSSLLMAGMKDKTVKVWDFKTGTLLYELYTDLNNIKEVKISPDGTKGVALSYTSRLRIWNLKTGKTWNNITLQKDREWGYAKVSFSKDGQFIKAHNSKSDSSNIYDISGKYLQPKAKRYPLETSIEKDLGVSGKKSLPPFRVEQIALNAPDGPQIDIARDKHGNEVFTNGVNEQLTWRQIRIDSEKNLAMVWTAETLPDSLQDWRYRDSAMPLTGDSVAVYQLNGALIGKAGNVARNFKLSNSGRFVLNQRNSSWSDVLAYTDEIIDLNPGNRFSQKKIATTQNFEDGGSGMMLAQYDPDPATVVSNVVFNNDDTKMIMAYEDDHVELWDNEKNELRHSIKAYDEDIEQVAFLENLPLALNSYRDGRVILWDLERGEVLIHLIYLDNDPKQWVHLAPNGKIDASEEAQKLLYAIEGLSVLGFEDYKKKYWTPDLWQKTVKSYEE